MESENFYEKNKMDILNINLNIGEEYMIQPVSPIHGMLNYAQYKNHPGKSKEKSEECNKKTSERPMNVTGRGFNRLV